MSAFWSEIATPPPAPPRIVFTDPSDPRILDATRRLKEKKLIEPILPSKIDAADRSRFKDLLAEKQSKLNLSSLDLDAQLGDPLYIGICLLLEKRADGLVGGSLRPTADIVRAALQFVGPKAGTRLVSGQFLIETESAGTSDGTPFLFADCAVVPEPSPRSLSAIAISAAESYRFFTGKEPRVAFLSFSTRGSAAHPLVDRIKEALEITRKHEPNLHVDGEIQLDAALDPGVAVIKNANQSTVAGKANVLVFPTLESGNIGYKLVQRFSKARIAGPLMWGLSRPMSDLSRGCNIQEIIDTALCVSKMSRDPD